MRMKRLLIGLILTAAPQFGQALMLQIDPAATHIGYTLGDVLHTVRGSFRLKHGEIRIVPSTNAASGLLVVDAASGASGSTARDRRMHQNILESDRYPEITFAPDRVIGKLNTDGPCDVQLHGTFTIHGTPHELTMPVHAELGHDRVAATASFPVPYVKWGMKNPSTFILRVKDTVQIDMKISGRVVPAS